jgi:hypothetical protein
MLGVSGLLPSPDNFTGGKASETEHSEAGRQRRRMPVWSVYGGADRKIGLRAFLACEMSAGDLPVEFQT